jgi:hypothetical protein
MRRKILLSGLNGSSPTAHPSLGLQEFLAKLARRPYFFSDDGFVFYPGRFLRQTSREFS